MLEKSASQLSETDKIKSELNETKAKSYQSSLKNRKNFLKNETEKLESQLLELKEHSEGHLRSIEDSIRQFSTKFTIIP